MRFDERILDEIKSRLRLSDVIGRTVKLRRQGREYVGLSPFTKEKTPSFFVNDDKGFFHDFSSGKHGDLISFLQETERLSASSRRWSGWRRRRAWPLPAPDPRARPRRTSERQSLADWLELAADWFEARAAPARRRAAARAYLERRGLPESEWSRFRLGFAPAGRTALKDYLVAKGAEPGELVEAGLLIAPEDGGAPYDRFRDRIIFPIADARGRVDLVRRPGARSRGAGQVPERAGDRALPQGPHPLRPGRGAQAAGTPAATGRRWWWSRAIWTSSPASGPAIAGRGAAWAPP